ncbi:hypothetical protein [Evansella tamaricis]|uniref:Uncharacterized protein n=1 Tax=Evansella tamaricis TaxID=2069301 RepID=A0ABS6JLA4_9BACI|nr:hypothetical protein [Evansella tamaricis]MBU9714445.1 hypothetical protein [Evansella tamaricis]
MEVGKTYEFKHRKSPSDPIITEQGKVLSVGITGDGMRYVETDIKDNIPVRSRYINLDILFSGAEYQELKNNYYIPRNKKFIVID